MIITLSSADVPTPAAFANLMNLCTPGSTVRLLPGEYRRLSAFLKDGMTVTAPEGSVILNGSELLSGWIRDTQTGFYYVPFTRSVSKINQSAGNNVYENGYERAGWSVTVYGDTTALRHYPALALLQDGGFFYDDVNQRIYLADNPADYERLEVSASGLSPSFCGNSARGVFLQNLTIEKYSPVFQAGAAVNGGSMPELNLEKCVFRHNYGLALELGNDSRAAYCKFLDNGQSGLGTGKTNVTIEYNEIARNNTNHCAIHFAAGGLSKLAGSTGAFVHHNWIHDNYGVGLWLDIDNQGYVIEHNLIHDNLRSGIYVEISADGVVRNNFVAHNYPIATNNPYHAQILVASSFGFVDKSIVIEGNTILTQGDSGCIGVVQASSRGTSSRFARERLCEHVHVIGNDCYESADSEGGLAANYKLAELLSSAADNVFTGNHYHAPVGGNHWRRGSTALSFEQWQSAGMDGAGTLDTATHPAIPLYNDFLVALS